MSWKAVELGSVIDVVMGQAPPSKDCNFNENGTPFVKAGEFGKYSPVIREWTTNPLKLGNKSDVFLCVVGATCGKINYGEDCAIGRSVAALRPKNDLIEQKFLYHFMSLLVEKLREGSLGAAQTVISKEMINRIPISLPPLATQQKIVAKLDAIFAEIDKATAAAEANAKNAESLFQSYLTQVFERDGEDWIKKSLLELANEDCSLSYGIVQPGEDFENGLPIVRPTNLTKKYISKFELKTINPALANSYKRTTLTGNELLLCVRGTTGTVSISTEELKGCNVTRGIVPIRFKDNEIDLDYAFYFFTSSVAQKQIKVKTYGAALLQINIADIKKLQVTVPKLVEQKKIVLKLNSVKQHLDSLISSQNNKIENIIYLKNSILKQAFNGELVKE